MQRRNGYHGRRTHAASDVLDSAVTRAYLLRVMRIVLSAASYYYYAPRPTGRVRSSMR